MKIEKRGDKWVLLAEDGTVLHEADSELDATKERIRLEGPPNPGAVTVHAEAEFLVTSKTLEERPFLIDGVALGESQIRSLANLVAGRSRRGVRQTMDLQAAIELWRRHNLIVTEGDKKRWRVHSASPTFREAEGSTPETLTFPGEFLEAGPDGKTWEVCLIRSGWSANGRYYPAEMLEQHLALFDGCPIAMYGWDPLDPDAYLGHVPPHVRAQVPDDSLVANIVGWAEGAYGAFNEDGGYEVRGTFHNLHEGLGRALAAAWQRGQRDKLGFSIDALGETQPGTANGRSGRIVTALSVVHETTVVSNPAAGGRCLRLVAAIENGGTDVNKLRQFLRAARLRANKDASGVDALQGKALCEAVMQEMTDAVALKMVKALLDAGNTEAATMGLEMMIADAEPAAAEQAPPPAADAGGFLQMAQSQAAQATSAATSAQEAAERIQVLECTIVLNQKLAEATGLNDKAKGILRKRFENKVFQVNELVEAVQEMLDLASVTSPVAAQEAAPIVSLNPRVQVMLESKDKTIWALDAAMGYDAQKDPNLSESEKEARRGRGRPPSIKEIYGRLTGDWDCRGRYGPGALCESTTSDFPNILGTSMERAMIQQYAELPKLWEPLVHINPNVDNFLTQDRLLWHGFAELPTVAESDSGTSYGNLGKLREEKSTYQMAKKGGLVPLTWEMFKNDKMNLLADIPNKLARASHHTAQATAFKAVIANLGGGGIGTDNAYDSVDVYHANHRNLLNAALSYSSLIAARQQLEYQFERGMSTTMNDSGGISSSDTSVVLTSVTGLNPNGGDYIQIEAEIIGPTTGVSSLTVSWNLSARGAFGTTAASHADGTRIYQLARPLPITKLYAVVPTEKRGTLFEILASERVPDNVNNNANFLKAEASAGQIIPVVVPTMYLGGDVNNWYLIGDPREVPFIEMAFLDNRQEPEIFLQDAGTNGDVFKGDVITYKVRFALTAGHVDFVGGQANIVS